MKAAIVGIVALALLTVVLFAGVPQGGGLTWNDKPTLARIAADERVELERLRNQDAADARAAETWRWLFVVGGVVGIVGIVAYTVRHNAKQRTAVQLAALPILAQRPGAHVEAIDGVWWVVDDARQELIAVDHRLPG